MNEQSRSQEFVHVRLKPGEVSLLAAICLRESLNRSEAVRRAIRTEAKQCGLYNIAGLVVEKEAGNEQ